MRKGNRDKEGNLGKTGRPSATPAGTSGREGQAGSGQQGNTEMNGPASRPRRHDDDEDSGLGNRTGLK